MCTFPSCRQALVLVTIRVLILTCSPIIFHRKEVFLFKKITRQVLELMVPTRPQVNWNGLEDWDLTAMIIFFMVFNRKLLISQKMICVSDFKRLRERLV